MISNQARIRPDDVAAHYDELDSFYREVWGEHIHHGLWRSNSETVDDATRRLIAVVVEEARLKQSDEVCDVGSGYGGTSRALARDYGARVTALTVSQAQYDYARAIDPSAENPTYLLRDWLQNGLAAGSFDVVIAIESSEHMTDLRAFFHEVSRVLRPGGRFVVCAWLTREEPNPWEKHFLLEPICREGRLQGMGSASEYEQLARAAGLDPLNFQDFSQQVKRTWPICARRVLAGLFRESSYWRFLLGGKSSNKIFALTLLRIWLAYERGTMRYGILTAWKPAQEHFASQNSQARVSRHERFTVSGS